MTQILKLHSTHPQRRLVRRAAEIVQAGGVIAYPTDTCYALGCRLGDAAAAQRIRRLRGVDERHHLTVVCRDLAEVGRFARMDNAQFRIVRRGSDGAFTFLLRATHEVPRRVQHPKRSTVGVRIPQHPAVRALLDALGEPILSSTLLLPGDAEPLHDPGEIAVRLGNHIDAILDAGMSETIPTTVVDLSTEPPRVVRRGRGDPAALGIEEVGQFG
ncbi:MAG TPA: L-threonylcarbamoyladenylate synthase [Casimicrobiaceae bacterium]|nr:L-threonylcarbamoyladenylate synthase [Casimicrobiaceae bacterium]